MDIQEILRDTCLKLGYPWIDLGPNPGLDRLWEHDRENRVGEVIRRIGKGGKAELTLDFLGHLARMKP